MITLIVLISFWILFSIIEGVREGMYFYYKVAANQQPLKINEHLIFALQRGLILVLIFLSSSWLVAIGCAFCFVFFHDGSYYKTRNVLNNAVYPKGFWDNPSSTSTAIMDFNLPERLIMLIGSACAIWAHVIVYLQ
jgi:hypothetical protein